MNRNNDTPIHAPASQAPDQPQETSPYAPPKAAVADLAAGGEVPPRPSSVTRAVRCLWACFVMGVIGAVWAQATARATITNLGPGSNDLRTTVLPLVFLGIGFLLSVWIYRAIARGRNWARIVLFVISVVSLLSLPGYFQLVSTGVYNIGQGGLTVLNYGVTFYACYLLLKSESSEWFRAVKAAAR